MNGYFYVSKIGGGKPSFKHPSFESAMTETQRLIDIVGGVYEILQAVAVVRASPKYIVDHLPQRMEYPAVTAPYDYGNDEDNNSSIPF